MLPPVLEIYVVWHPNDAAGETIAREIINHFHGTPFSGLIGGAVEVLTRSAGWQNDNDAPRPLPFRDEDQPEGLERSAFIAVVPIVGNELAFHSERVGPWRDYMERIQAVIAGKLPNVCIFPYELDRDALNGTNIGRILGPLQRLASTPPEDDGEDLNSLICRDLSQGIAQEIRRNSDNPLKIFISHTKHTDHGSEEDINKIISLVRETIGKTRLQDFFDTNDLQPGTNWDECLRHNAATSCLLAIRSDLYPSREWCQREVRIAKESGMPVIILDVLTNGEERGSFLMDHVPRFPVAKIEGEWNRKDVYRTLNALVNESLKRVLWGQQEKLATPEEEFSVTWWAPHAPEPTTIIALLTELRDARKNFGHGKDIIILHPDPPLGPEEIQVLDNMFSLTGIDAKLSIMTPRLLAARGG